MFHRRRRRSTPQGEHRPVLLEEVLQALQPQEGAVIVDCTLGFAGHSSELLKRLGSSGQLMAFDLDGANLPTAQQRLQEIGPNFSLHHGNFAGLATAMAEAGLEGCDGVLADLGMSSMQVDDAERGFSFMRDGPLDMRMDRNRGRTAAELLASTDVDMLTQLFRDLGDEPEAEKIAQAIVQQRQQQPIERTNQLMQLIQEAAPVQINPHPRKGEPTVRQQQIRPVARIFQALRIAVNRELANLQELLRVLPWILKPNGRAAIISFHSGEDRLVKASFREGLRTRVYSQISEEPIRAKPQERLDNPRSRSAKLRWAIKS